MAGIGQLGALNYEHDVTSFDCGNASLNTWLRENSTQAQLSGTARTFIYSEGNEVLGYFSLVAGSVSRNAVSARVKRGTGPHDIPVIVLARLAVDLSAQGRSLGNFLLQDAILRVLNVSERVGVRAIVVDPIDDRAATFYEKFGFVRMKPTATRLYMLLDDLDHFAQTSPTSQADSPE